MVRPPSYDSNGLKKGAWSSDEDNKLRAYIMRYGHWNWRLVPKHAGLARCGKSCRLRWVNYLKPGVKRGNFTKHEKDLIVELHAQLGNKWSYIATKLPGRTDNDIKNYWHAHIDKRGKQSTKVIRHTNETSKDTRECNMSMEEKQPSEINLFQTNTEELTILDALTKVHDSTFSFDTKTSDSMCAPKVDYSWLDTFLADPANNQTDYVPVPPLSEEGFFYPQFDCSDLSNSDSSYLGDLGISSSDYSAESVQGDSWGEPFVAYTSNAQIENNYIWPEIVGELYDNCLPYVDYGMTLL